MEATQTCAVFDCTTSAATRGWCSKHYTRWLRTGDPLVKRRPGPQDKAQATHCSHGHEWNAGNTYLRTDTDTRQCKECRNHRRRLAAAQRPPKVRGPRPLHVCSVPGCTNQQRTRVCSTHYQRLSKTGTYDPPSRPTASDRFWSKVAPAGPLDCWEWTGSKSNGYGRFGFGPERGTGPAYRWAYEELVGPVPHGLALDHLCRNPGCVNPYHLDPVTVAENSRRVSQPREHCACCSLRMAP